MTAGPGPLSPDRVAALLGATPDILAAEARGLGRDAARWRPSPDAWCFTEVVGHLIEADRRAFAGRIRAILATNDPALETWDPSAVAAARHDEAKDAAWLVAELRAVRADGIALVRTLARPDLARAGLHPQIGQLRVDELLAEWVHHDREHVRQALDAAQAWAWKHMGAARRFSGPSA